MKTPYQTKRQAKALTLKYAGKEFVFHSPFTEEGTAPWKDGDRGRLVRNYHCTDKDAKVDREIVDLWGAVHLPSGEVRDVIGGECFEPGTLRAAIEEHRFADGTEMRQSSMDDRGRKFVMRRGRLRRAYVGG